MSFLAFRVCCLYWLLAFRACCLYGLLGLLGVLLIWALNYPIYPPVWLISPSTPSSTIKITQHALLYDWYHPARPPVWLILPSTPSCMIDIIQHTLKGQKLCKLSGFLKLLPLQGALFATHKNPGRCPGLRASALSGRAAYMGFLAFRACCLYELLITQHASTF